MIGYTSSNSSFGLVLSQKHLTLEEHKVSFHTRSLQSGFSAVVAISEATKDRLLTTCFRGCQALAGNFRFFRNIKEVLNRSTIMIPILEEAEDLARDPSSFGEDHSFEIEWGSPVGWSSTDAVNPVLYHDGVLERRDFGFKNQARALFVVPKHLAAPVTSTITIVFNLTREPRTGLPHIMIQSIYPGRDVGRLEGDMTKREKVVYFDWDHPGERASKPVQKARVAQAASA